MRTIALLVLGLWFTGCRDTSKANEVQPITRVQEDCIMIKKNQASQEGRVEGEGTQAVHEWALSECGVTQEAYDKRFLSPHRDVDNMVIKQSSRPMPGQ